MMKYLVVLLVVVVVLWLVRSARRADGKAPARAAPRNGQAEEMVRCAHCGVHLPRHDALPGPQQGLYCSDAHRLAGPAQR
jgi:uncharacterized protein